MSGYRSRFAPSPTGQLHLGLARTALLGFLRARREGGSFVLRIEDIDTPRVVRGSAEAIMRDLRFLGIAWDEGPDIGGPFAPYVQSQRSTDYVAAIERLRAAGRIYPCTCSRKDIAVASAPHGPSEFGPTYPGTCRHKPSRPGRSAALRFRVPPALPSFVDGLSQTRVDAIARGDFIVQRADGLFSYQLAVVVDDIAMGITEVLRGEDLAGCTGWQLALYAALGAPPPAFSHLPLLLGSDGKRLSKRDAGLTVAELRARGMDAPEIVGLLAASAGLVPAGTRVMPHELWPDFALTRVKQAATRLEELAARPE